MNASIHADEFTPWYLSGSAQEYGFLLWTLLIKPYRLQEAGFHCETEANCTLEVIWNEELILAQL